MTRLRHTGFGLHHHARVEIVSYINDGTLTHRDYQRNVGTIRAGAIQVMVPEPGSSHSEQNEEDSPVHLFQIWLMPKYLAVRQDGDIDHFRLSFASARS